jgi:hypothetical protein
MPSSSRGLTLIEVMLFLALSLIMISTWVSAIAILWQESRAGVSKALVAVNAQHTMNWLTAQLATSGALGKSVMLATPVQLVNAPSVDESAGHETAQATLAPEALHGLGCSWPDPSWAYQRWQSWWVVTPSQLPCVSLDGWVPDSPVLIIDQLRPCDARDCPSRHNPSLLWWSSDCALAEPILLGQWQRVDVAQYPAQCQHGETVGVWDRLLVYWRRDAYTSGDDLGALMVKAVRAIDPITYQRANMLVAGVTQFSAREVFVPTADRCDAALRDCAPIFPRLLEINLVLQSDQEAVHGNPSKLRVSLQRQLIPGGW